MVYINVEQVCKFSIESVVCGDSTESANSVIITAFLKGKTTKQQRSYIIALL